MVKDYSKSKREWQVKNPDKQKEYDAKYYRKNKEKVYLVQKEYKKKNKEEIREKQRLWQEKNKDRVAEYREKNKEKIKKWVENNYERAKELWRKNGKRRRSREYSAEGEHTLGEWELLKKQYGYTCLCCKKKEPKIELTEDHIIPLSRGGSDWIENIQPLCRSCNSKKHTKIIKY